MSPSRQADFFKNLLCYKSVKKLIFYGVRYIWLTREHLKFQIFTMEDIGVMEDKLVNFTEKISFRNEFNPDFLFSLGPNCLLLFDSDNPNL